MSSNGTAAKRSRQAFCFGEGQVPEFVRRGIARQLAFLAGLHVDAVDALAVGGIGEADGQLAGVVLGLRHAFGQFFVPRLGLDDGQLGVAIVQHVIGGERLAASPVAFDAARRDRIFAPDAAALDHAPARRLQRGVDMFGSGFGFVHLQPLLNGLEYCTLTKNLIGTFNELNEVNTRNH